MKTKLLFIFSVFLSSISPTHAQSYPEMITVEGGTFIMGDSNGDGKSDEQPTHPVTLKDFKIAKTEITVEQWKFFCTSTGRKMPKKPSWGWVNNYPIVNITWGESLEYCDWLSDKTGTIYSLPTEAQWEYAARGGKKSKGYKYSGAQSIDAVSWFNKNSSEHVNQVSQKRPNELGIYDMSGNVWEWCSDWFGVYTADALNNPKGPLNGQYRIIRGGSWFSSSNTSRVSNRLSDDPTGNGDACGFRIVSSL